MIIVTRSLPRRSNKAPRYRLCYPDTGVNQIGHCVWEGESEAGRTVVLERGYEVDDLAFARVFLTPIPPELADLIDVALAVYTLDRLSPRKRPGYQQAEEAWQRSLEVCVPIRDPRRWERSNVRSGLEQLLNNLTDDQWTFQFSERQGPRRASELHQALLSFPFDHSPSVCLFSGGLDSLAGSVGYLLRNPDRHLICVAGSTSEWISSVQAGLATGVMIRFHDRVTLLRVPFHLTSPGQGTWQEESSQRARGFTHLILGVVAAELAAVKALIVHENGVGALNLPYTGAQFGAHMSRAMHPLVLAEATKWLSTYLGHPFRIFSTGLSLTKAQACGDLLEADLANLAAQSLSCDGFQRVAGQHHCGTCTSCLLRRQSIYVSGLSRFDNPKQYRFDVTDPEALIPEHRLVGLRLMLDQLSVLDRCLATVDPWRALVNVFPELHELEARGEEWRYVGGSGLPSNSIPALYRAYVDEWEQFPISPSLSHIVRMGRAA